MNSVLATIIIFTFSFANAEEKINMYFNNEELTKIIEIYSKFSGQKFVIEPTVRGKVSILIQEPVSIEEAFNQLSSALAINGYGISKQGDTMIIKPARSIQRDLVEVSTEKPSIKPERMYTWIYTVKNFPADSINRDLRILVSKDGEVSVNTNTNQLIFTDWVSTINRVAELLKEIDKPNSPEISKIVSIAKKERKEKMNKKGNPSTTKE